MERIERDCLHCEVCYNGESCPNLHISHFYCDQCGEETTLFDVDGEQLCEECLLDRYKIVEGSLC